LGGWKNPPPASGRSEAASLLVGAAILGGFALSISVVKPLDELLSVTE
jgi:hypothetical protein